MYFSFLVALVLLMAVQPCIRGSGQEGVRLLEERGGRLEAAGRERASSFFFASFS